ncbi:MAG: dihydroxyacetone kinase subunit L [Alicyclobacillus sp.]|nr:dihydroxyacetone kinase subunit L [Alicyclobacillus sp.]
MNREDVLQILRRICDVISVNEEYLSELDRAIGDGDHGVTMKLGCDALKANLPSLEGESISQILFKSGLTFLSAVGASVGPLYGTALMRAGQVVQGKTEITEEDIVRMFDAALAGIKERGKAKAGDKTMVDTIEPAVDVLRESFESGIPFSTALQKMLEAAKDGMESTARMKSQVGRSSRLGDRSVGYQDPGATSSYLMIESVCQYLLTKC